MIDITIPKPDVTITKQDAPELSHIYGFTDFHLIPRDRGGIFMFYNSKGSFCSLAKQES